MEREKKKKVEKPEVVEGLLPVDATQVIEGEETEVKWRKVGGGTFRMGSGRIIKPNQVFSAKPSEVPAGARKFVVQLSKVSDDEIATPVNLTYSLQVKSPGWYDIVDGLGKVINEKAMRQEQAKAMLLSLGA